MYVPTICTYPRIVNIHRFGPSDSRSRPGSRGSESGHEDQKREKLIKKKREKFGKKLSASSFLRKMRISIIMRIMHKMRILCVFYASAYPAYYITYTVILRIPSMMRMLRITGIVFNSRITTMIAVHVSHAQADH